MLGEENNIFVLVFSLKDLIREFIKFLITGNQYFLDKLKKNKSILYEQLVPKHFFL